MKIIRDTKDIKLNNSIITVGKYDGLHKGHRILIDKMKEIRESEGGEIVVITFADNPFNIMNNKEEKQILTQHEKELFFEMQGVDFLYVPMDTKAFLQMEADSFIDEILIKSLGMKHFICGENFFFGKDKKGDVKLLEGKQEEYNFKLHIAKMETIGGINISSSNIREYIRNGKMKEASVMLGYDFSFIGVVKHGAHLGTKLGMPTINILPEDEKILPPNGVYASITSIGNKEYKGITNVGIRPTVSDNNKVSVETNIFDEDFNIYGEIVEVKLAEFIRPEMKFENTKQLVKQINKDIEVVKSL